METIAAADAKTNFGALLDKAQRGPVTISKNGRAVAVLMSAEAYREQQQLKLEVLRREIQKGLDDVKRGRVVRRILAASARQSLPGYVLFPWLSTSLSISRERKGSCSCASCIHA